MAARLLPLLTLVLALNASNISKHKYTSVAIRSDVTPLYEGPRFFLRDTQCSGYITKSLLCGEGELLGVEVRVTDRVAYPILVVEESLQNVTIGRRPDEFRTCRGVTDVETRARCRGWVVSSPKKASPLPPAQ